MTDRGFNEDEIIEFLTKNQNESGYIRRELIPNKRWTPIISSFRLILIAIGSAN